MILAGALEVGILCALCASHTHADLVGCLCWMAYFRYSATSCALRALAKWLNDRDDLPPGGPA